MRPGPVAGYGNPVLIEWEMKRVQSFFLAAKVVVPLVMYMVLGAGIRRAGILSGDHFKAMNRMVFQIFLPITLFMNTSGVEIRESFRPGLFALTLVYVLLIFGAAFVIVRRAVRDRRDAVTIIQGVYRSNFVLFGTAVAAPLCSASGMALIGALSALVVPIFNVLAVCLFEPMNGGKLHMRKLLVSVLKNPLVVSGVAGLLFSLAHLSLPALLKEPLATLGDIATPLALVVLGGILSFESISRHKKYLLLAVAGRLVFIPCAVLSTAVLFGVRGESLVVLMSIFASPTAVASAPMAQSMGGNGELAGEIVAATTVISVVTIFLFVFVLSKIGLI